jgi:cytosine/adenosine deaminase-related metal-dependent hydrolase
MTLTNAHTHLELTDLAHLCPSQPQEFARWMMRLAPRMLRRSPSRVRASIERGIVELLACGTTHVGDVSASWLSVEPLLSSGLQGIVYLEVLGLERERALRRLAQAQQAIARFRQDRRHGPLQVGLSLHAPYTCHPELLRQGAAWCREQRVPLCIHAAESPMELDLLLHGRVPWAMRLLSRGKMASIYATRLRPIAYLSALGVLAARPLLVHAVQVNEDDIALIAESGGAVAHCPRSNARLGCGRMPLEAYLAAGVPVYLGSDSRASCPDLDVRREGAFAQALHQGRVNPQSIDAMLRRPLGAASYETSSGR